jgi:hypothetical protein
MWRDIVLLQWDRPPEGVSLVTRIRYFAAVFVPGRFEPVVPSALWLLVAAVVVLLMIRQIVVVIAHRQRPNTWGENIWWSFIGLAQITALSLSPSFYYSYPNFAAPILCLLAGIGVGWLAQRCVKIGRWFIPAVLGFTYGVLVVGTVPRFREIAYRETSLNLSALSQLIAGQQCTWVVLPTILILAGKSTQQIARGCPMFVDSFAEVLLKTNQVVGHDRRLYLNAPDWQAEVRRQWQGNSLILLNNDEQVWLDTTTRVYLRDHFKLNSTLGAWTLWKRRE